MGWLSNIAPVLGTGLGALFAAPTGGLSMGMGALIGGSVGAGVSSAVAADEANKQNIAMQRETNAQSIDLSNSAHQREMADLRAAGLNPILSAKYGGASTPSLTSPTVQSTAPAIQASAAGIQNAFLNTQNLAADLEVKKASVLNSSAQAVSTAQDASRKLMENEVLRETMPLAKYKAQERYKSRSWDLLLDDAKRGVDVLNPFSGGSSGKNFKTDAVHF